MVNSYRLDYNTNFLHWRTDLVSVLEQNQVKYVLTEPKPPEPNATTPPNDVALHQNWLLDDITARRLILGALHVRVYVSYHHHATAASLLEALTAHFTKPSMSRRLVKFRRYMEHKLAEGKLVNEHLLEMGSMAAELESEGVKVSEELQVLMLLNSLPDSWDEAVGGLIVNMDLDGPDDMGLDEVTKSLIGLGLKKHQEENPRLYATIKVAREEDLAAQIGRDFYFDLVDLGKVRSFCILKETPFYQFKKEVAKEFGIPVQYQRYWRWSMRQNSTSRPSCPLTLMEETVSVKELNGGCSTLNLFLEVELGLDFYPIALPDRTADDILLFFKLYDPEKEQLRYVGRLYVNRTGKPTEILSKLNEFAGYALYQEIDLFEEIKYQPMVMCEFINKNWTFQASQLEDGDIICFQKPTTVDFGRVRYPDVPSFLNSVALISQIKDMETTLCNGTKIADKEIVVLTEFLMVELLKLDSIEADGEAKVQRRVEVRRIQSFVDALDNLKARNSNPFSKNSNSVSVATKWQSFELGVGSLDAPTPLKCSTKITQDWELFD